MPRALSPLLLTLSLLSAPPVMAGEQASDGDAEALRQRTFHNERPMRITVDAVHAATSGFVSADSAPECDMPHEVAFTPDGTAAVIAHKDTDNVSFFDVNTRQVTHVVDVADLPVQVAVTPDGRYALVPCPLSDVVAVIDVATHTRLADIAVGGQQPYRVQVSDDSRWAVVGLINDGISSAFAVIDLMTLTQVAVIPSGPQGVIGGYFSPEAGISGILFTRFAFARDGGKIVLPDRGAGHVRIYDRASASLVADLVTAASPGGVDISNDSQLAVVSHGFTARRVSTINLVTNALVNSWPTSVDLTDDLVRVTPDKSHAMIAALNNLIFVNLATGVQAASIATGSVGDIEISFDGQFAFVSNFNARVIDIPTRTLVKTITFAACAEAAVSPVARRAVALNNRFGENIHVYDINGAAGFLEGFALTGPPPEGDGTRSVAVSADGRVAVAGNVTSRNVTVFDLVQGTPRAWIETGDRPLGIAITPDSTTALVCNGDNDTVSVIDLTTDTVVQNLPVSQRPGVVAISPDGQTAYVTSIAGQDRVWFIDVQGASSSILGSILAGQMGSAGAYAYGGLSDMALSADGSILAVCLSFDDQLMLVDTATRTEIARVPIDTSPSVTAFPMKVAWKPDGTRAYVTNLFANSVSVVNIAGASSSLIATVPGITFPSTVTVDASGSFVYVTDTAGDAASAVRVISTATNAIVASVPTPGAAVRGAHLSSFDNVLYLAADDGLVRVQAAGVSSSLIGVTPLSNVPAEMGFSESLRTAVLAQPIPDGVDLQRFEIASNYCIGAPNSFGTSAQISYAGFTSVSLNDFTLVVDGAAPNGTGLFLYGLAPTQVPFGDGFRCVRGQTFRLGPPTPADPTGTNTRAVDFTVPPASVGAGTIAPGLTRYFQYWYRNFGGPGGTGFNLSNGLAVTFSP